MGFEDLYLGFKVDRNELHPLHDKIIQSWSSRNPHTWQNCNLISVWLHATRVSFQTWPVHWPLYELLKKNSLWQWVKRQHTSYKQARGLLVSPEFLVHGSLDLSLALRVDASPYGLGAVISHHAQEVDCLIVSALRTLTCAEKNYPQLDKEALAVVFGVTKFKRYVFGREFTITTDHKPLLGTFGEGKPIPVVASARMQQWALTLQWYRYKLIFVPGKENVNTGACSHLPLPPPSTQHFLTPAPPETVHLMAHRLT